ncbi:MAG: glucuronyl esterase domain-containing protein [Sphingomicrobium sp.]
MSSRFAIIAAALAAAAPVAAQFNRSPERQAATEKDYHETLARLGITHVRPGADGYNKDSPNYVNYDESKAGPSSPPPPIITVAHPTPSWWWKVRRPQLVSLLEREMYGRVPATVPKIEWQLVSEQHLHKFDAPAIERHYRGTAKGSALAIDLSETLPEAARHVPVVLELGFPEGFRFPGMPAPTDPWQGQVLRRGWAYAIIVPYTVQPDDGAGLKEGVIGIAAQGKSRGLHDWGALRAWAWGASRALDLFASQLQVDSKRVAVEGLSRYGKAALVTMAFDPRFSIGFIGSSGAGGAKPLRRNFGEKLENLTASGEYHWFAPEFLRYGGPLTVNNLPVDADDLIALAAPRPLFISAGNLKEDGWVDPHGSFIAGREASPVYRLLGEPGLVGATTPAIDEARTDGCIAFREHEQGHTTGPNWPGFLDWAARIWSGASPCITRPRSPA